MLPATVWRPGRRADRSIDVRSRKAGLQSNRPLRTLLDYKQDAGLN